MEIKKSDILNALALMPNVLTIPDLWPLPSAVPNFHVRVMSFDVLNPEQTQNPIVKSNMQLSHDLLSIPGQLRPEWQTSLSRSEGMSNPAYLPYTVMAVAGLTAIAWLKWQEFLTPEVAEQTTPSEF